jgi:hypothetical protein
MSKTQEIKGKPTLSGILVDGTIFEQIHNPNWDCNEFVMKKPDGTIETAYRIKDNSNLDKFIPLNKEAISHGIVVLPDGAGISMDPTDLFSKISSFLRKYVDMDENGIGISASYVMMTYLYDKFEKVPYLRFFGLPGTGKSRALLVLRSICYHSMNLGASQTAANLYRSLSTIRTGTLFLDEANFLDTSRTNEFTKLLNDGYSRDGVVYRCDPKTLVSKPYRVFSPKVLANHIEFDDPALESRMLSIELKHTKRGDIPLSIPDLIWSKDAMELRNLLTRYRLDNYHSLDLNRKYSELTLFDHRTQEIILPLLQAQSIAKVPAYFLDYLHQAKMKRHERRIFDEDAIIAEILISLIAEGKSSIALSTVQSMAQEKAQIEIPYKRLGYQIRLFGANPTRVTKGYVYNLQSVDLTYLKNQYELQENID